MCGVYQTKQKNRRGKEAGVALAENESASHRSVELLISATALRQKRFSVKMLPSFVEDCQRCVSVCVCLTLCASIWPVLEAERDCSGQPSYLITWRAVTVKYVMEKAILLFS